MNTRRTVLSSIVCVTGVIAVAGARTTWGEVMRRGPKPKLIKGNPASGIPDRVDFGHGLLVPMSTEAFHTLWEGDDRWITYGHGFGHDAGTAMEQAEESAIATMKLYILTLAFTPERLVRVDGGGWRLKSGNIADLVKGDIKLPGRPVMPTTDRYNSFLKGTGGSSSADADSSAAGMPSASGEESTHATTGWLIWKSDVTLDYVRDHARILAPG
jgi:hypothetical protein